MPTNEELEKRVAKLERWIRKLTARAVQNCSASFKESADYLALYEGLIEVAVQSGVDRESFISHLEAAKKRYHHEFLSKMERFDPWFAALIDTRDIKGVPDE